MNETNNCNQNQVELWGPCAWLMLHFMDHPGSWVGCPVIRGHVHRKCHNIYHSIFHGNLRNWTQESESCEGETFLEKHLKFKPLEKMGNCGEFKYFIAQDSLMSSIWLSFVICHLQEMTLARKMCKCVEVK